jgi:choline dehydrogenase-like flavoprotein
LEELQQTDWDAIVVGTGMGGGTIGYALAKAGKRVLFLEKGLSNLDLADTSLRRQFVEVVHDIGLMAPTDRRQALARGGRAFDEIDDVSTSKSKRFLPYIGTGTGGSSALYGMACERLFPEDFTPRQNFPDARGTTLPDAWPVSFEEMLPWYEAAEALYHVHGGADPLRPAEHAARLAPSPPFTAGNAELAAYFAEQGLHPYPLHLACELLPDCQNCQGVLCPAVCKFDAGRACVAPAIENFGAVLLPGCTVRTLEASKTAVHHVVADCEGHECRFQGKIVVLAAGALVTPLLLLQSKSVDWPRGLANQSDLVGRNLMRHCIDLVMVSPKTKEPYNGQTKEIAFNDFYNTDGLKLGTVQSFGPLPPFECLVNVHRNFGSRLARLLRPSARWVWRRFLSRALTLAAIMEDLPYPENRVLPPRSAADAPIQLCYTMHDSEKTRLVAFRERMKTLLRPYRPALLRGAEDNKGIAHVCGTCRFGTDPKTSVLDPLNRAHGLDNLYVADSSFFPSSAGLNPSLTIAANALRVATHLNDRL